MITGSKHFKWLAVVKLLLLVNATVWEKKNFSSSGFHWSSARPAPRISAATEIEDTVQGNKTAGRECPPHLHRQLQTLSKVIYTIKTFRRLLWFNREHRYRQYIWTLVINAGLVKKNHIISFLPGAFEGTCIVYVYQLQRLILCIFPKMLPTECVAKHECEASLTFIAIKINYI